MFNSTLFTESTAIDKLMRRVKQLGIAGLLVCALGVFSPTEFAIVEHKAPSEFSVLLVSGENPDEDKEKEDGDALLLDWLFDILIG